ALEPMAYYPITIAEKIAGEGLNEEHEADVELVLNSSAKWYLGTDGNSPVSKYDLVTVVIHEICHGLGFFDSMDAENSVGSYGLGSVPIIYDKLIENLSEKRLTDTTYFKQNSASLYQELVSGQLYFAGPVTRRYLSGARARLYSPSVWDPGSSVSHLDETRTAKADALMTPYIDLGEAIHNPGNLTKAILGDLGWINTRILPQKIKDTEELLSEIEINTKVKSDTAFNREMVGLVWSFNDFLTVDTLIMSSPLSDDSYSGMIQIPSYNTNLEYYFFVPDDFLRLYKSPSLAEKKPYSIYIGTDTVKPVISHSPEKYYFENIDTILFEAVVTDNLGIDTVYIEYRVNEGPLKYSGMILKEEDKYALNLYVKPELLRGGDIINYRIIAADKASARNIKISPSVNYYSIRIETLMPAVTNYSTDFYNSEDDFYNSGFEIKKPSNFKTTGLHSEHPYKSPNEDYKSLEFSSVLRHPVICDASGLVITFRELVLVEPGAEGSVYGFSDFYDFVIIEASKDFGKNWFALADGYDSRHIPSWETDYNSSISGDNSTYEGNESMMVEHAFYPRISDMISNGDSLLIRFRLYSDPYANGWGWAIDDLKINPLVDEVEEIKSPVIKVYPNPGNGIVNFTFDSGDHIKPVYISVYNWQGVCIVQEASFTEERITLDLSRNPPGLYLIVINGEQGNTTMKYNLIK
ncbi:MAG: T9SS type A sorting domain-containing protein, partial [Bacteroidia bacterium]